MNSSAFDNLVSTLKNGGFTNNKADAIKTAIHADGQVSSAQVAQLLKFIAFNKEKLEVAKMAYRYATVVGAALSYSDAKAELNKYIRGV